MAFPLKRSYQLLFGNEIILSSISFKYGNRICVRLKHDVEKKRKTTISESDERHWPNLDTSIWMRTCEKEVIEPISGKVIGQVPKWLKGSLLRNGPGSFKVGNYEFNHLFDGSALLHKFKISNGEVKYQRRFVQTDVYKKNHTAQRIVVTEFGTRSVPDPCQSIFQRVSSIFQTTENMTDNSMISIYPFGDEYYTFTENPVIHRIDTDTLETKQKINLMEHVNIINHTSHPHVMNDGTVYNVGMTLTSRGPSYSIMSFSPRTINDSKEKEKSMFDEAKIVGTVPSRWLLNPSYMHTFGITDNFFIIIEQPLAVNLVKVVTNQIKNIPLATCLKWHENEHTLINIISRKTGQLKKVFIAEAFFYLHIINQYETQDNNHIVLDVCCYKDAKMLDCMYIDCMKNIHSNPDYASLFRGRPIRFILPLKTDEKVSSEENLIDSNLVTYSPKVPAVEKTIENGKDKLKLNEIFWQKKASSYKLSDGNIFVKPELLCDMGCETPRINSDSHTGKEYRYFYAISSDVDLDNPGTLIKVDIVTRTKKTWCEKNVYPSEPIFVPSPDAKDEDDGVILSALIWGEPETEVGILILDAKTFKEIARATFTTPGPVPKCLHGWFQKN